MNSRTINNNALDPTITNLSQAIFAVNRHAKTALDPKFLYGLKKAALKKMILEKKAIKTGLHFSRNPKFSQQQSDVIVKCGEYTFHIPPTKEDFTNLPHLGHLDQQFRNPKSRMSLNMAKRLLQEYTGIKETNNNLPPRPQKPVFKKLGDSFFN
ncbi:YkyB family protein [Lederbergia lenta]|uniref:Protein YkyB n=1 Tax=Lederbergia lenta TaxID=1467 RepID=A0A2X4Z899_LEDLE|nr:YkyB family protein [Lederbergia lenta]MCM3110320.1 YkyB family protein [Lederbergia lenta]MEC2324112.1 YkyB family protein [Lederbergia lenta]SQI60585.1 protein YkyB [Lederbergia lenta]